MDGIKEDANQEGKLRVVLPVAIGAVFGVLILISLSIVAVNQIYSEKAVTGMASGGDLSGQWDPCLDSGPLGSLGTICPSDLLYDSCFVGSGCDGVSSPRGLSYLEFYPDMVRCDWLYSSGDYSTYDTCSWGEWTFSGPESYVCSCVSSDPTNCYEIYNSSDATFPCTGSCDCTSYLSGFGGGAICGNGAVEGGETCDDGNTVTENCGDSVTQSGSYCSSDCSTVLSLSEVCDGNSQSCTTGDGYLGTQSCSGTCTWNICTSSLYCGDSSINGSEVCDGTVLGLGGLLRGAVSVSVGEDRVCALLSNGAVKCWGSGMLGDNTTSSRVYPVNVSGIATAVQVSSGWAHSCAVLSNGTIMCWGYNAYGQLGDNTTTTRLTPVAVKGISNAIQVSAGGSSGAQFSCAVLSDGTAKCWGYNNFGELGDNTTTQRLTPVSVYGITNALNISVGLIHACAVLSNGTIMCWGDNDNGKLGDNTTIDRLVPVAVRGIGNAVQVGAGDDHSCALLSDGTVKCWGYGYYGAIGDSTSTTRLTPVSVVGISNAAQITAGGTHSCAVLSNGSAMCWGHNHVGQIGDNTTTDRYTIVAVYGVANAIGVSGGFYNTCFALSDRTVKCDGANYAGDGTTAQRHVPVYVTGEIPTCLTQGFTSGNLTCSSSCFDYNTTVCTSAPSCTNPINLTSGYSDANVACTGLNCVVQKDITFCNEGIIIGANSITLDCSGYRLTGNGTAGKGVYESGKTGVTVKNCNISNFSNGIYLAGGYGNNLTNNFISTKGEGNYNYGIYLNSANSTINSNIIFTNGSGGGNNGISVYGSNNSIISNNITTDSLLSSNNSHNFGIALYANSNSNKIRSNGISTSGWQENSGIQLYTSSNNTITSNIIHAKGVWRQTGISLNGVSGSSSNNIITSNSIFAGSSNSGENMGIATYDSFNNVINSNNITINATGYTNTGVILQRSTFGSDNNTVMLNSISVISTSYGSVGVSLYSVSGDNVTSNNLSTKGMSGNNYGFHLISAVQNSINSNNVSTTNGSIAIRMESSASNFLSCNNFYDNGASVSASGDLAAELSYNDKGNFWGRTSGSCFIPGTDSNRTDIIDSHCYYNDSICANQVCGDSILMGTEVCDGNLRNCTIGGYVGNQLCNSSCSGFGVCVANESCGDGIINNGEQCDDHNNMTALSCGIGACTDNVADSCVSCINITCTPGTPTNETCNNVDDDCDSSVDESVNQTCYAWLSGTEGIGNCKAGLQTCSAGLWGSCIGEVGPVTETCGNNIDDNCNGQIDEGCRSGGGGGYAPVIVVINEEMFRAGYRDDAAVNSQFQFNAAGGVHSLKIIRIRVDGVNEVTVVISSEPITLTLKVGDKKEVDVNGDGINDFTVELFGIENGLADFKIKEIVYESPVTAPAEEEAPTPETQERDVIREIIRGHPALANMIAALTIAAIFIVIVIAIATERKRPEYRVHYRESKKSRMSRIAKK